MKTNELTGAALDWAVAQCEGYRVEYDLQYTEERKLEGWWQLGPDAWRPLLNYSTNWAQSGQIIERELIELTWKPEGDCVMWVATLDLHEGDAMIQASTGSTPLIAAMRCYVASNLGDAVEVPEELK